jgi:hypothetical protein
VTKHDQGDDDDGPRAQTSVLAVRSAPRLPLTGTMVGLQAGAVIEGFTVAVIVLSLPEHVASGYLPALALAAYGGFATAFVRRVVPRLS